MFSIKLKDPSSIPKKFSLSPKQKNETRYNCGNCKKEIILSKDIDIVCNHCGSRILYKLRINKPTEYLCR